MNVKHSGRSKMYKDDKAFMEWLESISRPGYQKKCRDTFLTFLDYLGEVEGWQKPTGDKVLERHNQNRKSDDKKIKYYFDDLLPKFAEWLKETKGIEHNSSITMAGQVRGFFTFHRESLKIQKGKLRRKEKAKKFHVFKPHELRRMVRVANIDEKPIILLGKDEGIRVGDFIRQKRKPIIEAYKDSGGQFPLEVEIETEKEGVVAVVHVMGETWEALQDFWSNVPESEYVFPSNGRHISEDTANYALKETWKRAYPERRDTKIRFHELRGFKMSALSNAGVNKWHIKRMVGKKLSDDIITYLRGIDLKADFMKAEPTMKLIGHFTGRNMEIIEKFQNTIANQQLEIKDLKTRLEAVTDTLRKIEKMITLESIEEIVHLYFRKHFEFVNGEVRIKKTK